MSIAASIELDKQAIGRCQNEIYTFSSSYEIVNDGLTGCDEVVIEDIPSTMPMWAIVGSVVRIGRFPGAGDAGSQRQFRRIARRIGTERLRCDRRGRVPVIGRLRLRGTMES